MRIGRGAITGRVPVVAGVLGLSAALFVGFGVGIPDSSAPGSAGSSAADSAARSSAARSSAAGSSAAGQRPGAALSSIAAAQRRLRQVPGDWPTWAQLGAAYVAQARQSADPTFYPMAQGAFARSLAIHPNGNDLALAGQGSLAAARHDFAGALRLADRAIALNPFSATAYGVRADALVELGRYPQAWAAIQRMTALRPDLSSFTRASYAFELRGQIPAARAALERALADTSSPADAAYALFYLGELAWNGGDVGTAANRYAEALARDPSWLPPLAGRAKVETARGQTARALADYRTVVDRLPQPSYVIEYGELLESLGRIGEARAQYNLVRAEERIFRSQGVDVDLEVALFEADHGDARTALAAAGGELAKRRSILVEDAYAWTLHRDGRDREAVAHARSALRLGTASASLHYHLGAILAALGDRAGATRELRTALALNPSFSPLAAKRARTLLDSLAAS